VSNKAVLFSGGYNHPFADSSPVLASHAAAAGWQVRIEEDFDAMLEQLADCKLLLVNALYWTMVQDQKYAADRARWAFAMSDAQFAAIDRFVSDGGRLFVLHVGTICWDSQPLWREIMGGGWQWGRSFHPPFGRIDVDLTTEGSAMSHGAGRFVLEDEAYHHLDPAPDCIVLATCSIDEGAQPVAWVRRYGTGRVAVDALGHNGRSLSQPGHAALIGGMLRWLAGAHGAETRSG
jgi:type 1 glutamine amidotransferase